MKRKARLLGLTIICLSCYLSLKGYSVDEVDFQIRDIKIETKDLEKLNHEGELISYHDVLFADTLFIEYYEALVGLQGKRQKLKLGIMPMLYYPADVEEDVHTRAAHPQISNLPHISVFNSTVLLRRRKINRVEVYLHNRRLLSSNLILAPYVLPFHFSMLEHFDDLPGKLPHVQLSHIYNSDKPYPKFKMQGMTLSRNYDYNSAFIKYTPLEYIPSQRKLYVYDMRIVFHYENELIPLYENIYNRPRQFSLVGVFPGDDYVDVKNVDMRGFNYGFKSYPDYRQLLIDDYEIPASEIRRH